MFIFIVGFFIFILVKISSAFKNFLLRMFGVQSELASKEQEPKETNDNVKVGLPKRFELEKSDLLFMLVPSILGTIAFIISIFAFWGLFLKIASIQTVDAEAINGLLAISGIIFAFQAFFLKKPIKRIRRLVFTVIFLIEVLTLSYIGFSYIGDISNAIFPSIGTFFFVFFSLIFTLANTSFFIVYDLFFPYQEGVKERNQS